MTDALQFLSYMHLSADYAIANPPYQRLNSSTRIAAEQCTVNVDIAKLKCQGG